MADLSITDTQVLTSSGITEKVTAGETITAGQAVYRAAAGTWWKAQSDGTAIQSGSGTAIGIAISGAAASAALLVQRSGIITLGAGAAPTAGVGYWLSNTAGGICVYGDLGAADYVTFLGIGISGNKLAMGAGPIASGQTL